MKLNIKLLSLILNLTTINCVTYLRPKNDRGPGTTRCLKCLNLQKILTSTFVHYEGAVHAGRECIENVERFFFKNEYSQQVQNIAVFHTKNMTSPAMEIEIEYLYDLHDRVLHQDDEEDSFQLKIISDVETKRAVHGSSSIDVILTDFYVVVSDKMETLKKSIKSISLTASFNEEGKFLILVNNPMLRDGGKLFALEILDTLFVKYRTVNVVVLYATDAFSYDIYTGDPYHGANGGNEVECGRMTAMHIGRCNIGKIVDHMHTGRHLMMNKVPAEMHKCTFNFCARVQEPFINEGCQDGLEIQIIHFLQEEMGFEINLTCSELDRGEPNDDGTWSDLLGQVRDDSCDIIAGAFFPDHEVHADFASTEFYLEDFYTFYVQKAPFAPRWKGLVYIFKIRAWTACLVVLIVSWISWWILGIISKEPRQHRKIILTFMNVLCVTLGVSANNRPVNSPLRVFFSMLALYALTITAIYTSKLITVFTNPTYDHQIDSVEEILERNLPIGGRTENMDWFENEDSLDREVFDRYNHTDSFRPSTKTLKQIKNGEMTLLISRLYVQSNKHRNDVFGLTQSMFANHLEMIVERGFPLLRRINAILASLRDMGLMSKLFVDFNYKMTILTSIREIKSRNYKKSNQDESEGSNILDDDHSRHDPDPEIVLTVEHLEGAFTLLLMGIFVSSMVFVLEIIFHSKFMRKILTMLWRYIRCRFGDEKIKKKHVTFKKVH